MIVYDINGIDAAEPESSVALFLELLHRSRSAPAQLSVGFFTDSPDACAELLAILGYSVAYQYIGVDNINCLLDSDILNSIRCLRLKARGVSVTMTEGTIGGNYYDWDGARPEMLRARYEHSSVAEPESWSRIYKNVVLHNLNIIRVNRTQSNFEETANLIFDLPLSRLACLPEILAVQDQALWNGFEAVLGIATDLKDLRKTIVYERDLGNSILQDFLVINSFGTRYAVEPSNFFVPVPNCDIEKIGEIFRMAWKMRQYLSSLIIKTDYLDWALKNGGFSPRSHGNCCSLILERSRISLQVGANQIGDSDPKVAASLAIVKDMLKTKNLKLQRI